MVGLHSPSGFFLAALVSVLSELSLQSGGQVQAGDVLRFWCYDLTSPNYVFPQNIDGVRGIVRRDGCFAPRSE